MDYLAAGCITGIFTGSISMSRVQSTEGSSGRYRYSNVDSPSSGTVISEALVGSARRRD
jgi:hypothetical protein